MATPQEAAGVVVDAYAAAVRGRVQLRNQLVLAIRSAIDGAVVDYRDALIGQIEARIAQERRGADVAGDRRDWDEANRYLDGLLVALEIIRSG